MMSFCSVLLRFAGGLPSCIALLDVVEVSQQEDAQAKEAKKSRQILTSLKVQFSELGKASESVLSELQTTEKQIHNLGDEMVQLQKHSECLELQSEAAYMENVQLQISIEQEEENFQLLLAGHNTYRNKMEAHKEVVSQVEGKTATQKELMDKRDLVKKLKQRKEELRIDLLNPEGNVVRQVQEEIDDLKVQISEMKENVKDKTVCIVKEQGIHTQLKKDIEIQNRRCEAILKRLHCQLNKAQSNKRQLIWDIHQMEKKIEDLRKCFVITD
ncbi:coiled-coil domain-containing protein 122 isoform X2 [Amia ocellicauda]|uniref:coiled-coil domain-containing protein 122 isoform X2 n=1 Tax=Amia ocellicauda TaxID=2972642 RepID=UPI003463E28E